MAETAIEWTDKTWNITTGCNRISPGCDNCYALTLAKRLKAMGQPKYQADGDPRTSGPGFALTIHPDGLDEPLKWRKPQRVFVDSMSDLFHEDVPDEFLLQVFATMAQAKQHTFQVLTKRSHRMASFMSRLAWRTPTTEERRSGISGPQPYLWDDGVENQAHCGGPAPRPNVWLGASVESDRYTYRADHLRATPAAVRFLSLEPLLGPLPSLDLTGIDWVIVGGESGRGARPMHPDWVRDIRDRCVDAGVAFFFKQWGEYLPTPVVDCPSMWGGRGYAHPDGSQRSPVVRSRGQSGTFRNDRVRLMGPGDRTGAGVMLDHDTFSVRVGKKVAGRQLDGRTWDEMPAHDR